MNFVEFKDVSSTIGSTKIGLCSSGGEHFKCVEKVYGRRDKHEFEKMVKIVEKFPQAIEELGPHMHLVDKENTTVYMEYIECDSLREFLKEICIDHKRDHKKLRELFQAISVFMKKLKDMGLCHGDLHADNLMVCSDMTLRMIDIDTLESTEVQGWCDDKQMLGEEIYRELVSHIVRDKESALVDAKLTVDMIYKQKFDDVEKIIDKLGVDEEIRGYMR